MGRHRTEYAVLEDGGRPTHDRRGRPIAPHPGIFDRGEYAGIVGARARRLREEMGLTLQKFAREVRRIDGGSYSAGLISRLERGFTNSPLATYVSVADALMIDPAELMGPGRDPEAPTEAELTMIRTLRAADVTPEQALIRVLGVREGAEG